MFVDANFKDLNPKQLTNNVPSKQNFHFHSISKPLKKSNLQPLLIMPKTIQTKLLFKENRICLISVQKTFRLTKIYLAEHKHSRECP